MTSLRAALEPYIDIPFNSWLSLILILAHACATRKPGLLLLIVLAVSATIIIFDTTATFGEMAKTLCLLPLGLGSVLAFLTASRPVKTKLLPAFTAYVNFAVYGNIVMMVGTPTGGTLRGWVGKGACLALFVWILQQGYRVGWKTIRLHDNMFVFTSVSKSWIFTHAIYRFVLLTLPCFGSGRRHRLMEVYSLGMTYALSKTSNLPFEYCFGMADTLVAPAAAAWSATATTFSLIPRDTTKNDPQANLFGPQADAYLTSVQLGVVAFAFYNMLPENAKEGPCGKTPSSTTAGASTED